MKLTTDYVLTVIGADIMDSTSQNTMGFGRLKEERTWFELDHVQRKHFDAVKEGVELMIHTRKTS